MNNSLGDKIRELRKTKNLTQEELADGICTSVSISRIENGIQMPSSTVLEKILDRLGTSTNCQGSRKYTFGYERNYYYINHT